MMRGFLPNRKKKEPIELQLTAMIDIFSMIVVFLIMGSVFGVADLAIPEKLKLPTSFSKESVEAGPTLVVSEAELRLSLQPDEPISPADLRAPGSPRLEAARARIKEYVDSLPAERREVGATLSVIADEGLPYERLFEAVKAMREAGFRSMLFIAMGESKKGT